MIDTSQSKYAQLITILESVDGIKTKSQLCSTVVPTILDCIAQIGQKLHTAHHVSMTGTANTFGDDQLNVDVLAEDIIRSGAASCPSIVTLSSEEDPVEKHLQHDQTPSETYSLAFDPLDGSSIIAPNWTVGTIIGVWEGNTALHEKPTKQIAAILGVYGPRTTVIVAVRAPGTSGVCIELGLTDTGCEIIRKEVKLSSPPFKTRYFAPANLRAAAEDQAYLKLINHYISEKYTLRYSGGLVPDVLHILVKGHGIYISPVTKVSKAKLRNLFELAPIALIMECAGAQAINPLTGKAILTSAIMDCDERAGLICGTAEEVDNVKRFLSLA